MPQLLVLGGDSFGDYHARQLARHAPSGSRILVVAADWSAALRDFLAQASADDQVVPGPRMPHLLWEWLAEELGGVAAPAPRDWRLPFEQPGAAGEVYLSAAGWICPATCVEPAHCPVLHGPRDWDLADLIAERAAAEGMGAAVFRCLHYAGGVGAVAVSALRAAAAMPIEARGLLVATSSRCHAAVGSLHRGPVR